MTKQEMLYEQYNDALFRLLMHSVAQHQGQQYQEENQALKAQEQQVGHHYAEVIDLDRPYTVYTNGEADGSVRRKAAAK